MKERRSAQGWRRTDVLLSVWFLQLCLVPSSGLIPPSTALGMEASPLWWIPVASRHALPSDPRAPLCAGLSLSTSDRLFRLTELSPFLHSLLTLCSGGLLAFGLSFSEFLLVSCTSSLTLSIAGIFKVSFSLKLLDASQSQRPCSRSARQYKQNPVTFLNLCPTGSTTKTSRCLCWWSSFLAFFLECEAPSPGDVSSPPAVIRHRRIWVLSR